MQPTRPEIVGNYAAVSSSHWIASACAMRMLEQGGNAFDAAVAGGFALQVVAPHLNGPAGETAILLHHASSASTHSLCGQGPVPADATLEKFRALGLDMVPGTGLLAAVVPGAFDAWMLLLRDYGSMDVSEVLAPALHYAEKGIPVGRRLHETVDAASGLFRQHWPHSARAYLPGGKAPAIDSLFRNPALARTIEKLMGEARQAGGSREQRIDAARRAWSRGFVAEQIDQFCRTEEALDVSGRIHGALLRGEDLAHWSASLEPALLADYAGWRIAKCGPWSQGPVMLQAMSLLEPDTLSALDPLGAEFVHQVTEAMKLAFADREVFYGDTRKGRVPMGRLLSPDYARWRRGEIGTQANNAWRPGAGGWDFDYAAAAARQGGEGLLAAYGGGEPTIENRQTVADSLSDRYLAKVAGDTCHIDVVDEHGNMVSATPSGGWLQSSPIIPELGFPLGTRAQMTWLDPRSPSCLEPGARPRTTLTPTLVLDAESRGYLACGTPGGDQQDQWQLVFLLRHLIHGMGLQEGIEAPSFHSNHWPNSFYPRHASPGRLVIENRFGDEVIDDLRRRGHDVVDNGPWTEGRLTAVARETDGRVRAAANPRGGIGYAVGR